MNKKYIVLTIIVLIYIALLTRTTIAKYSEEYNIQSNAKIAKSVIILDIDNTKEYNNINKNSKMERLEFNIKNYNEIQISDVEMLYSIEIVGNDSALTYTLYNDNNKQIPLIDNKTNYIKIESINKAIHNYSLDIDCNNASENDNIDIYIKLNSIQKER